MIKSNEKDFEMILIDIFKNMATEERVFSNEAQLQYELAVRLKDYDIVDNVELEVLSSNLDFENFKNKNKEDDNKFYTDIVVKQNDGSFVAIELKFKTPEYGSGKEKIKKHTTAKGKEFYTFSQGAEDVGSYLFWKDVERLEKFNHKTNPILLNFDKNKKVVRKFAIIMTNSEKYWNRDNCRDSLCDEFFPMQNKVVGGDLCYKIKIFNGKRVSGKTSISKNNGVKIVFATRDNYKNYAQCYDLDGKSTKIKEVEPIFLNGKYVCNWNTYIKLRDDEEFKYLIIEVE